MGNGVRKVGGQDSQEPAKPRPVTQREKFRETMMKVGKVDEVDEERKKKQRQREETLATEKPLPGSESDAPSTQPSPMQIPQREAPPTPTPRTPPTPSPPSPVDQFWEDYDEQEQQVQGQQQTTPTERPEQKEKPQTAQPEATKKGAHKGKKVEETHPAVKAALDKKAKAAPSHPAAPKEHIKIQTARAMPAEVKHVEKKEAAHPAPVQPEKKEEETAATTEEAPVSPTPPPEQGKSEETKKKAAEVTPAAASAAAEALAPPLIAPPAEVFQSLTQGPAPSYAHLTPEVFALFDRMVGVMTVMQTTGITETSVMLTDPQYSSSPFFGSEIVITEYSTAPLQFNIQLKGSPQAVSLFQNNIESLEKAFAGGNYNFKVNQLEAVHSSEEPRRTRAKVRRKEKSGGDTAA